MALTMDQQEIFNMTLERAVSILHALFL